MPDCGAERRPPGGSKSSCGCPEARSARECAPLRRPRPTRAGRRDAPALDAIHDAGRILRMVAAVVVDYKGIQKPETPRTLHRQTIPPRPIQNRSHRVLVRAFKTGLPECRRTAAPATWPQTPPAPRSPHWYEPYPLQPSAETGWCQAAASDSSYGHKESPKP